eukprot:2721051-Alexandrium_andersonii.AAC.1
MARSPLVDPGPSAKLLSSGSSGMVGRRLSCLVRLRWVPEWVAPPPARLSWAAPEAVARRTLQAAGCR